MHSSTCDLEPNGRRLNGAEVFVAIAALVTEGRTPPGGGKARGFSEGPHCLCPSRSQPSVASQVHVCNPDSALCIKYGKIRSYVLSLWQKSLPLCIDVLLVPKCCCESDLICNPSTSLEPIGSALLLEQWHVNINQRRTHDISTNLNINQLINALRSQLYFSQISAWLATPDEKIRSDFQDKCVVYCLTVPGETYGCTTFANSAQHHKFPTADLFNGVVLHVSLSSLPRTEEIPLIKCSKCDVPRPLPALETKISVLDDRMQTFCTLKGKHRCEDYDELENCCNRIRYTRNYLNLNTLEKANCSGVDCSLPSTSTTTSRTLFSNLSNLATGLDQGTSKSKLQLNANLVASVENICDINKCNNVGGKSVGKCDKGQVDLELSRTEFVEVLNVLRQSGPMKQSQNTKKHDLVKQSKGDILLDAILRSSKVRHCNNVKCGKEVGYTLGNHMQMDGDSKTTEDSNEMISEMVNCKRKCAARKVEVAPEGKEREMKHWMYVGDKKCDNKNDSINSDNIRIGRNHNIYIDTNCDNIKRKKTDYIKMCDISNVFSLQYLEKRQKVKVKQKITFDDEHTHTSSDDCNKFKEPSCASATNDRESSYLKEFHPAAAGIPSALEQAKFRKSLDSAASMVFHSRTGLPLTSSPAPVRRGKSCFDFDSSINSVSAIRSALFSLANCSTDEDSESDCSIVSPCSPDATNDLKQRDLPPTIYKHRGQSSGLLGSFVESVLNGRLEPVSTVHGFSAELGASGSFCPRHVVLPVTVFFYTLGDNDKVSTPYLGHINLGKKGYNVPKSGTIQVTLFNPLGTVVKMFVIMYDLSDMPPNSQTFIRQRTLFMPANCDDTDLEWSQKWLRYLIHLRFLSSKSGRIFLHTDIRMIICRKSDLDTATAHGIDMSYELRSFTNCPINPRFSPRK